MVRKIFSESGLNLQKIKTINLIIQKNLIPNDAREKKLVGVRFLRNLNINTNRN